MTSDDQPANVRTGPAFSYDVSGVLAPRTAIEGVGSHGSRWVRTTGGFVHRATLTMAPVNPAEVNGRIGAQLLGVIPLAWNSANSFEPGYSPETPRLLHGDAIPELATLQTAFTDVFGHPAVIDLAYRDLTEQHYWFDRFGAPRAAVPGTSNHGFGLAIDFEEVDEPGYYSWGSPANDWLLAHAPRFGFVNPFPVGTWGEDYHFNFVG